MSFGLREITLNKLGHAVYQNFYSKLKLNAILYKGY